MSRKKTLTAVFVILICILIGGAVLRQYKRANTTECVSRAYEDYEKEFLTHYNV